MGTSQADKQASHDRIVEVASRKLRETGWGELSVADVMDGAGLTHGGFYKHFDSKDALVAAAAAHALRSGGRRLSARLEGAEHRLERLLATYLSADHRDGSADGCGVAALANGIADSGDETRRAYTERVEAYVRLLDDVLPATTSEDVDRDDAIAAVSALVGALLLSRAVDDPALSNDILTATRRRLAASAETRPQSGSTSKGY